ncbi:MAG: hypothetical protein ABJE47_13210 [bacterium]
MAFVVAFASGSASVSTRAHAQERATLPLTPADWLITEGRWAEAEALFYLQSERSPRNPILRASLGRFLAMKGAVSPGTVLIEEARQFGLDTAIANDLLKPLRAIAEWRLAASELKRDSTFGVRATNDSTGLFRIGLPRTARAGRTVTSSLGATTIDWHDVVDRGIGLDSVGTPAQPIGIEIFEAFAPSFDVRRKELTLHTNARSALAATGKRYQLLRTQSEIRVLIGDRRVMRLADALRELSPSWWQLDLPHGLLVVR